MDKRARAVFGDWQTPPELAKAICRLLQEKSCAPHFMLEPTCGQGNFIEAALAAFPALQTVCGIEIYAPYLAHLRSRLSAKAPRAEVKLQHADIFSVDPTGIIPHDPAASLLILGNPPWVTNSALGAQDAAVNLPPKDNLGGWRGIEALTGKSNFDIATAICLKLLPVLYGRSATLALLLKNSVIVQLLRHMQQRPAGLISFEQYALNAWQEFGASTAASLLLLRFAPAADACCVALNPEDGVQCTLYDFYTRRKIKTYGWCAGNFVSNCALYRQVQSLDGSCPFTWRSGMKHDCAAVLELTLQPDGSLQNGLGERADVEAEVLYPWCKGADLNADVAQPSRCIILPQRYPSEDTAQLALTHPRAFAYLSAHGARLDARRSRIYQGRPRFAVIRHWRIFFYAVQGGDCWTI